MSLSQTVLVSLWLKIGIGQANLLVEPSLAKFQGPYNYVLPCRVDQVGQP